MKLSKVLRKMISSLTEETYSKESYFKERDGKIINCPHGLAQIFVNPKVARALTSDDSREIILAVANDHATPSAAVAFKAMKMSLADAPRLTLFNNRPEYVKQFFFNCGELSIHWLLGLFGITSRWNSHEDTKFVEVKERLNLALEFAVENDL